MQPNHTPRFAPSVETLEERRVPTTFRGARIFLPGSTTTVALQSARNATVAPPNSGSSSNGFGNMVRPSRVASIVPNHISLGGFDKPNGVVQRDIDSGFHGSGLPLVFTRQSDFGISAAGIRTFTPAQPLSAPPLQPGGLRVAPWGVVYFG